MVYRDLDSKKVDHLIPPRAADVQSVRAQQPWPGHRARRRYAHELRNEISSSESAEKYAF
jgi:hypothetical protein